MSDNTDLPSYMDLALPTLPAPRNGLQSKLVQYPFVQDKQH